MSRIGKLAVTFDKSIQVNVSPENEVVIKGAKFNKTIPMKRNVKAVVDGNQIVLQRIDDSKESKSLHGAYRTLVYNAIVGATQGFTRTLELVGVGYRAGVKGKMLELTLGYSHPIEYPIPQGIEIKVEKQTSVTVSGPDKELVGQVAAKIRSFREPEPFLGKGVKYSDEVIRRKAGKAAGK
ncbi:MAG: 50S ribosomal protein L6 [Bdellovibrionales bacterium CG10_big_fil_rev_8_21_14_0_10_45_34]|nr:MAG: 50S ribosomal protein L6 [Bdellovibrionales bacterium CG10_big_fil_rev_8_21_14_0_10_45_34]